MRRREGGWTGWSESEELKLEWASGKEARSQAERERYFHDHPATALGASHTCSMRCLVVVLACGVGTGWCGGRKDDESVCVCRVRRVDDFFFVVWVVGVAGWGDASR